MRKLLLATLIVAGLSLTSSALASAYEWIDNLSWSTTDATCCSSNENVTFRWRTNTSGAYDEYRSVYYYVTTTSAYTPDNNTAWTEWAGCRLSGTINGSLDEKCAVTVPTVSVSSTLWVRRTTNFSGCGTWTPTPDTTNCGDAQQSSHDLIP